ncbi:MAG TPA: hypothetical protein VFB12_25015 [Ktedonobacteraceae bacterium]|nr:hypothetical protein [Ktedonobacteraceae bacterium]
MAAVTPLASWQNFYVIIGTAAATLMGLLFVMITLIAGIRRRMSLSGDGISVFSTPNVVHFGAALFVAALLSAPWPALWNASLLLGIGGLVGVIYIIIVMRRARHSTIYQPVLEDWLFHVILPFVCYAAFLISAIVLSVLTELALFVIAAAMLLLLFIGIHNAWDNVTYMTLMRSQSENQSQD